MRKLLRKIILWALASEPVKHDAEGMDKVIRDLKAG